VSPARALTVSDILAQRAHAGEPSRTVAVVVSILAHASFLVGLALVSRPRPAPFVPTAIRVGIVNPALFEKPAPVPAALPAAPPAPVPEAKPEPKKGPPVIEKVNPDVKASAKAMPDLKSAKKKPEREVTAPRAAPAAGPAIELPSSPAAGGGNAGPGTLAFGTSVAGLDVDFPFAYYVDQLLQLIGANWLKPSVPDGTSCVVTFRVLRSGQITDVKLETTSALPFYDRAAARAVYSANPLPPLPQEFVGETLGVHLKFQ
jgi:TonB family protein